MDTLSKFRQVWRADFEFYCPPGERPTPLCVVAKEEHSGVLVRHWLADGAPPLPPYGLGPDTLFIAYYASAELSCHLALDWPMPARILDLYAEFRCLTSGLSVPCGNGLLGALAYFGEDGIASAEKEEMRQLAMRGGRYTESEKQALLDYCQSDVDALGQLLPKMSPLIDFPRAFLRGRFMAAVAKMEERGVPIDLDLFIRLKDSWDRIKGRLIREIDMDYGVFQPIGVRKINPDTRLGAALLQTADEFRVNVHALADAVDYLWVEEKKSLENLTEAKQKAREKTGLTPKAIAQWERSGQDYSTYRELDVLARDLADEQPELGLGQGYNPDGTDQGDQAGLLWEKLRTSLKQRPKHDPDLLRQAAEMIAANGINPADYYGPMRFSTEHWAAYLAQKGIPWPRLPSGLLALDDDTFREMARAYPAEIGPIRELRYALSQLKLNSLAVGLDGRNRTMLSAFASRTGRNQPSNSKSIFGPSAWLRGLIRPEEGKAIAYVDWSAQELAIAAALSGDKAMQNAYTSGDPYLWLAKQVGAVPDDATKKSHPHEREQFKVVSLGVLYGLSAEGLARRLGVPPCQGRQLLLYHQETFRHFWKWSDAIEMHGMLVGWLQTVYGWRTHAGQDANPRSLRNFPMQGNGAEMMRIACCLATERGLEICCPIHDAILVESSIGEIDDVVAQLQDIMREASELVLPGFPLRTDAKIVRYPDRYMDPRGEQMWNTVCRLLGTIDVAGT